MTASQRTDQGAPEAIGERRVWASGGGWGPAVSAGLIAVALLIGACGGGDDSVEAGDQITTEFMVGTWTGSQCACDVVYEPDGTYRIEQGGRPVEQGEYTVQEGTLTFVSGPETLNCDPGDQLVVDTEVLEESDDGRDRVRQVLVSDDCSIRGSVKTVDLARSA